MNDVIYELNQGESDWWAKTIKRNRNKEVKKPVEYISKAINFLKLSEKEISKDPNAAIGDIRNAAWNFYIKDELNFHKNIINLLINERPNAKKILDEIASQEGFKVNFEVLPSIIGDYLGRAMPYIYQVSLSTTNSRRSRSGKTLENIAEIVFKSRKIPFEDQKALGATFYKKNGLGKMVDMIVPSGEVFEKNRRSAMIITMKTSLRERWAEVVEEIQRTNIPNIHLLTLDPAISNNLLQILDNYNITVVTYDNSKDKYFKQRNNIIGFTEFFEKEIPHYLNRN